MLKEHILSQICADFEFEPTPGQKNVMEAFAAYLAGSAPEDIFVLNGYAGTGKTTLVAAIVATLRRLKIKPIVLAPTGRAAKVAGLHARERALTIHKKIYRQRSLATLEGEFTLDINRDSDACFFVDEASMLTNIADTSSPFGSGSLLDDLVRYVRSGTRCRLVLVGDSAQLPPVGYQRSPALDPELMSRYGRVVYASLDDVVRHGAGSGILFNATLVRCMIEAGIAQPPLFDMNYPDMQLIEGNGFLEAVEDCYARYGKDETIVITRSNKRAGRFNEGIRRHVLFAEEEIASGDMLMIVKNNYHYTEREENCPMDFMANGDIALLQRIRRFEDFYGFRFAQATLRFADYDDYSIDCRLLLDTLASAAPSLGREDGSRLFFAVAEDYADIRSKAKRYKEVRENPYFNAVQVKFAYAVTCHKAQGGQWKAVFIDKMLFGDEEMSIELLRWLYTALTRATEKVYLVNFDERFMDK